MNEFSRTYHRAPRNVGVINGAVWGAHARPEGASVATSPDPEEWRPVRQWENDYEVSNLGRVRNAKTGALRALQVNRKYPTVTLHIRPRSETIAVHRLVAHAFIGPRPDGMEVRHVDGDHANSALSNLAYGTHSENMLDRREHGTARNLHTGKTHCKRGHEFTPENTYHYNNRGVAKRSCKTCAAARSAQQTRKPFAAPTPPREAHAGGPILSIGHSEGDGCESTEPHLARVCGAVSSYGSGTSERKGPPVVQAQKWRCLAPVLVLGEKCFRHQ